MAKVAACSNYDACYTTEVGGFWWGLTSEVGGVLPLRLVGFKKRLFFSCFGRVYLYISKG